MGVTNLSRFDKIMILSIMLTIIVVVLFCVQMYIESSTLYICTIIVVVLFCVQMYIESSTLQR